MHHDLLSRSVIRQHLDTSRLDARLLLLVGSATTAVSGSFMELSGVSAATSTFYRCLLALPLLGCLAFREYRRHGGVGRKVFAAQLLAGALLGVDLALWAQSITMIGPGIATVVANVQIIVVPLLAWIFLRHRAPLRFVATVPLMLAGVALAGGILGGSVGSHQLLLGTVLSVSAGVAYAGYLFIVSCASPPHRTSTQVFWSTLVAGLVGAGVGSGWGELDLSPSWPALGWMAALALCSQVLGWMCLGLALPRLAAEVGATLLLTQPIMAIAFAVVLVGERPTLPQLTGCVVVVCAVWLIARRPPSVAAPEIAAGAADSRAGAVTKAGPAMPTALEQA